MSRRMKKRDTEVIENRIIISLIVLTVFIIIFVGYSGLSKMIKNNKNMQMAKKSKEESLVEIEDKQEISAGDNQDTESASSNIGKNVVESQEENDKNNSEVEKIKETSAKTENKTSTKNEVKEQKQENKPKLTFIMPVEGEIIKGFFKDNLVFSDTLQEWVLHQALDIKANSRDVVKCSAEGVVKAIKNDPRYGLTVIVEHADGFQTVYSNLLTAEYVVEGENVKQGQTLGTVGNSATFEIADESHLHFEMLLNSEYVDPNQYIK